MGSWENNYKIVGAIFKHNPVFERRSSGNSTCILTGFRIRRDSDQTGNNTSDTDGFSTDDETSINNALYRHGVGGGGETTDETTTDATTTDHGMSGLTSCSCSRRSSYGVPDMELCTCLQCTAGRIAVVTTLKATTFSFFLRTSLRFSCPYFSQFI